MSTKQAPQHIAVECERAFQNGGPRVYTVEADGGILPSSMSARAAARCAFDDQTVYARQKQRAGRYEWVRINKATP